MQTPASIEREIRAFLSSNFPLSARGDIDPEQSLVESGVIDSLGVLELVEFVETRFNMRVLEEELLPENLDSIANITHYLSDKLQGDHAARIEANQP
jgi:acyl carrier protein